MQGSKCSFFEKKEPKKPRSVASEARQSIFAAQQKDGLLRQTARNASRFFCFFFFKKRTLLLCLLLSFGGTAFAEASCDTLVIPPGVGVGSPADVTAFNPLLADSLYDQEVANYLYAGLFWFDKNDQIDWSRSIARKVDVSDNGQRYLVTMRPWPWSDGRPVTADDVLYSWELIQKLGLNFYGYGQGGVPTMIKSLRVIGREQFEITLSQPANPIWFELNGLSQLTPYPRHSWGKLTTDELWEDQSNPKYFTVVDGPFKIDRFDMGRFISFVDNPSYPLEHMPFKRIVVKFVQTGGAELQGIEAGELDISNLPLEALAIGNSLKHIHLVVEPPSFGYTYMGLNFKNPLVPFFRDVRVRQAIQDAIDEKSMIKALWHGYGVQSYSPVPPLPPTFLSPAARAGHFPVGYDPKKAAALLDQAGYLPGPDGIRAKDGVKLSFIMTVPTGTINEVMMAQFIQPELRNIGIVMKIQQEDFNQLNAALQQSIAPWQSYILIWTLSAYPSGETTFNTGGSLNFSHYSDPKMDEYINESTNQPGLDGLYKYQDYASEQLPYVFLPLIEYPVLERDGISGVDHMILPSGEYEPQLLGLNKQECDAAH